jgi:NTP pyrophosphatase (non-canonical NTP hydrolase)
MNEAALSVLQARLKTILRGLHHPPLGSVAALTEETGELAKHLVDHHCYGKPFDRAGFGSELADVFICLTELATLHGVELEAAVLAKIAKIERLAPEWRASLGPKLEEAWRAPHGAGARHPDSD